MRSTPHLPALAAALAFACLLVTAAQAQEVPAQQPQAPQSKVPEPDIFEPDADSSEESSELGDPDIEAPAPGKGGAAVAAPLDRDAMLAELYQHLAKAPDAEQAAPIAKTIETLWLRSGSDTIGLLMRRALKAVAEQRTDLALKLLDAVVDLAPDYAEGWSRRAYVYYLDNNYEHAAGDLRRALALEPNHYKALEGLARILRESGQKKSALEVYQQLLRIHPYMPGAKEAVDELSLEVEGQGI
jgi:tetratricopeptide (TPR) repeat protein